MRDWIRRVIALATLVAFIATSIPADLAYASQPSSTPALHTTGAITIPEALGTIKESWAGAKSKSTVIHIQDAHCNYYAQTKIAEIIKYLNDNYDVNTINLEGGAKDYNLFLFTGIKDKAVREKASDHLVREGVLNGAEYFAANNPEKISLWGIEDSKLYIENLRVYRESIAYKADVDKFVKILNYDLSNLKTKIYSRELLELDRKENAYKEKSIELKDYIAYLIDLSKSHGINISDLENIGILNKTISLEPGIDFKRANIERDELVDRLTKQLSRIEVKELVEKAVEFKLGRLTPVEFYSYLTTKSKELKVDLDEYKNLALYIGYTQLYSTIKNDKLFKELDILENRLREKLYQNPEQRELNKLSKNLSTIKNIFGITLTPDEYKYYTGHRDEFRMENYVKFVNSRVPLHGFNFRLDEDVLKLNEYLEKIEKFYIVSLKRDQAFLKNLKFGRGRLNVPYAVDNSKISILITGGFHSENLAELFKKNNISYISIVPNFKEEDGYESPYFKLLSGEKKIVLAKEVQKLTGQALAYCSPNTVLAGEVEGALPAGRIEEPSPIAAPSAGANVGKTTVSDIPSEARDAVAPAAVPAASGTQAPQGHVAASKIPTILSRRNFLFGSAAAAASIAIGINFGIRFFGADSMQSAVTYAKKQGLYSDSYESRCDAMMSISENLNGDEMLFLFTQKGVGIYDPDPYVRGIAATILGDKKDKIGEERVQDVLTRDGVGIYDKEPTVRCEAITTLYLKIGTKDTLKLLSQKGTGLYDADSGVRIASIKAIGKRDKKEAASILSRGGVGIYDRDPVVRLYATIEMFKIGAISNIEALQKIVSLAKRCDSKDPWTMPPYTYAKFEIAYNLQILGLSLPENHPQKGLLIILSERLVWSAIFLRYMLMILANQKFIDQTSSLPIEDRYSLARAIEVTLRRYDLPPIPEKIEKVLIFLMEIKNNRPEPTILDKDSSLLIIGQVGESGRISELAGLSKKITARNVQSFEGVTDETGNISVKNNVLRAISDTPGKITIWFLGHGLPRHFNLSRGTGSAKDEPKDLNLPDSISYANLADALLKRAMIDPVSSQKYLDLSGITIMAEPCYSANLQIQMLNHLYLQGKKQHIKIKGAPLIVTWGDRGERTAFSMYDAIFDIKAPLAGSLKISDLRLVRRNKIAANRKLEKLMWDGNDLNSLTGGSHPIIFLPITDAELTRLKNILGVKEGESDAKPFDPEGLDLHPDLPVLDFAGNNNLKMTELVSAQSGRLRLSAANTETPPSAAAKPAKGPDTGSWFPDNEEWTRNAWLRETGLSIFAGGIIWVILSLVGLQDYATYVVPAISALTFQVPHRTRALNPTVLFLTAATLGAVFLVITNPILGVIATIGLMITHRHINLSSLSQPTAPSAGESRASSAGMEPKGQSPSIMKIVRANIRRMIYTSSVAIILLPIIIFLISQVSRYAQFTASSHKQTINKEEELKQIIESTGEDNLNIDAYLEPLAKSLKQAKLENYQIKIVFDAIAHNKTDRKKVASAFKSLADTLVQDDVALPEIGFQYVYSLLEELAGRDDAAETALALRSLTETLKGEIRPCYHIQTILSSVASQKYALRITERLSRPDVVSALSSLSDALKPEVYPWWAVNNILYTIAPRENVKEIAERLVRPDVVSALDSLIKTLEREGCFCSRVVTPILTNITPREDVKEITLRLQNTASKLTETKKLRKSIEDEFKQARQKGEFLRRSVRAKYGSYFVVYEAEDYYVLLTNTHCVGADKSVTLTTNTGDEIGKADIVLRYKDFSNDLLNDISIVVTRKDTKQKLVPIKTISGFTEGDIATLVSGRNDTVTTGHLVSLGDSVLLLGADEALDGDSGSPYLIKVGDEYRAVAVNNESPPSGIPLTPEIIKDMLRALSKESSDFTVITKDESEINAARKFLEELQSSGYRKAKAADAEPAESPETKDDSNSTTFAFAGPIVSLVGHLLAETSPALGIALETLGLAATLGFIAYITPYLIAKWRSGKAAPPAEIQKPKKYLADDWEPLSDSYPINSSEAEAAFMNTSKIMDELDFKALPVGTLVYMHAGTSWVNYLIRIESGGMIKLWVNGADSCYFGQANLLSDNLSGSTFQANTGTAFPYFTYEKGGRLKKPSMSENGLWVQSFPFFRVLLPPEADRENRDRDQLSNVSPAPSGAGAATLNHSLRSGSGQAPPTAKEKNLSINRILPTDVDDALIKELAAIEEQTFSDNPALILGKERISASLSSQGGINIVAKDASGNAVGYMLSQPENPETLYGTDLAILPGFQDKPAAAMLKIFRAFTREATRAGYKYMAFHARRVSGVSEFFQRIGAEKIGEEENRWNSGETFDIIRLDLLKLPSSFVVSSAASQAPSGGDSTAYAQAAPLITVILGVIAGSPSLIAVGLVIPYIPIIYRTIHRTLTRWKNTESSYVLAQISLYSMAIVFLGSLFYSSEHLILTIGMAAAWFGLSGNKETPAIEGEEEAIDEETAQPAVSPEIIRTASITDAARLANGIIQNGTYVPTSQDMAVLSDTLRDLFREGFDKGFFNDPDIAKFFETRDSLELRKQPIAVWTKRNKDYNNDTRITMMLKIICKAAPALGDDIAKICCAIGMIFYDERTYTGFSRSELFARLAHEIDVTAHGEEGCNLRYYHEWIWAMKHCGRESEPEARREMDKLLALDKTRSNAETSREKRLYMVEMANMDLDRARVELGALGAGKGIKLPEDKFIEKTDSIGALIRPVLTLMWDKRMREYPRALSLIAEGYFLLARLNRFKLDYIQLHFPQRKDGLRKAAINIMDDIYEAVKNSLDAWQKSGATDEQEKRTGRILHHITIDVTGMLKAWSGALDKYGIVFPDNIDSLISTLEKLNNTAKKIPVDIGPDLEAQVITLMNQLKLHETIISSFKEELKACAQADVENPDEFFAAIKDRLKQKVAGGRAIDYYVDFYKDALPLDKAELAIIHTYFHILSGRDERTPDNIISFADDLVNDMSKDEWLGRLRKIENFLKLDIAWPEEKTAAASKDEEGDEDEKAAFIPVKTNDIVLSIGGKAKSAQGLDFIKEAERLEKDFNILVKWDSKEGIHWNHTGKYRKQLEDLLQKIKAYKPMAAGYIEKVNALSGSAKVQLQKDEGSVVARYYKDIRKELAILRKSLANRRSNVISVARKIITNRIVGRDRCKTEYRDIDFQWIQDVMDEIDFHLRSLDPILDENAGGEFLSYDEFSAQLGNLDSGLQELSAFGKKLETFKPLFAILEEAKNEAELYRILFGNLPFIEKVFLPALQQKKEELFKNASEGRDIEDLSDDELEYFNVRIKRRTGYMAILRKTIQESSTFIGFEEHPEFKASYAKLKNYVTEIEGIVRDDIAYVTQSSFPDDTVRSIFNITLPLPEHEAALAKIDMLSIHFHWKIHRLFDIRASTSPVFAGSFIRRSRAMEAIVPGVFPPEKEASLTAIMEELNEIFEKAKLLKPGARDFELALAPLEEKNEALMETAKDILDETNAMWRKRIDEERIIVYRLIMAWLDGWLSEYFDRDRAKEARRCLEEIRAYLNSDSSDIPTEILRVNAAEFGNILSDIKEEYSFTALVTKLRPLLREFTHSEYFLRKFFRDVGFKGKEARTSLLPVIKDGILCDIDIIFTTLSVDDPAVIVVPLFEANKDANMPPEIARLLGTARNMIDENYNSILRSEKKGYEGITLAPQNFGKLISTVLAYYRRLARVERKVIYEGELDGLRSIKINDVILECIPGVVKEFEEDKYEVPNNDHADLLVTKLKYLQELKKKRPLSGTEEVMEEKLSRLVNRTRTVETGSWIDEKIRQKFIDSLFLLLGKVTGEEYAVPPVRLSLTPAPEASQIPFLYNTLKEYRGVYFNTENMSFEVSAADSNGMSEKFAYALNESFKYYLDALEKDGEQKHLRSILDYLKKKPGKIDMAVVKVLPVNSLVVINTNTILFDADFIEFLIANIASRAPPKLIFGERIMHEFGNIAKEEGFSRITDPYNRMVEVATSQLETDIILLENIYRSNPDLPREVDDFVHEKVPPQNNKFSSVFSTARLFTHINRVMAMYRSGNLGAMRLANRIFVIETLKQLNISPFVRLFPNSAKGEEAGTAEEMPISRDPRGSAHMEFLKAYFYLFKPCPPEEYLTGKVLNIGVEERGGGLSEPNVVTYLRDKGINAIGLSPVAPSKSKLYIRGVVQQMPFDDNEFDTAVSVNFFNDEYFSMEGMQRGELNNRRDFLQAAAREVRRVLKDGGKLSVCGGDGKDVLLERVFKAAGFDIIPIPSDVDAVAYIFVNRKSSQGQGASSTVAQSPARPAETPLSSTIIGAAGESTAQASYSYDVLHNPRDVAEVAKIASGRHWYYRTLTEGETRAALEKRFNGLAPSFLDEVKKLTIEMIRKDDSIMKRLKAVGHVLSEDDIVTIAGFGSYWCFENPSDLDLCVIVKIPGVRKVIRNIRINTDDLFKEDSAYRVDKVDIHISSEEYYDHAYLHGGAVPEDDVKDQALDETMFWRDDIIIEGRDFWAAAPSAEGLIENIHAVLDASIQLNRAYNANGIKETYEIARKIMRRWAVASSMIELLFSDSYLGIDNDSLGRIQQIGKKLKLYLEESYYMPQSKIVDQLLRQACNEIDRLQRTGEGTTLPAPQKWEQVAAIARRADKVNYEEILSSTGPALIRGIRKEGFDDVIYTQTVRPDTYNDEPAWWGQAHEAIGIACKLDKGMHQKFEPGIVAVLFEINEATAKKYNMDAPYGLGKTWQAIPLGEISRAWAVSVDTEEDFHNNLVRLAQITLPGMAAKPDRSVDTGGQPPPRNTYRIDGVPCNLKEGIHMAPSRAIAKRIIDIYAATGILCNIERSDRSNGSPLFLLDKVSRLRREGLKFEQLDTDLKDELIRQCGEEIVSMFDLENDRKINEKFEGHVVSYLFGLSIAKDDKYNVTVNGDYPEDVLKNFARHMRCFSSSVYCLEPAMQERDSNRTDRIKTHFFLQSQALISKARSARRKNAPPVPAIPPTIAAATAAAPSPARPAEAPQGATSQDAAGSSNSYSYGPSDQSSQKTLSTNGTEGFVGGEYRYWTRYPFRLMQTLKRAHKEDKSKMLIVDLGCAAGHITTWTLGQNDNFRLLGLEKDGQLVSEAIENARRNGSLVLDAASPAAAAQDLLNSKKPAIAFKAADLSQGIPLENDSVDAIIMDRLMHAFTDQTSRGKLLDEITRVLKPNGFLSLGEDLYVEPDDPEGGWYSSRYRVGADVTRRLINEGMLPDTYIQLLNNDNFHLVLSLRNRQDERIDETIYDGKGADLVKEIKSGNMKMRGVGIHEKMEHLTASLKDHGLIVADKKHILIPEGGLREGHATVIWEIVLQKREAAEVQETGRPAEAQNHSPAPLALRVSGAGSDSGQAPKANPTLDHSMFGRPERDEVPGSRAPYQGSARLRNFNIQRYLEGQVRLAEIFKTGRLTGIGLRRYVEEYIRPIKPDFDISNLNIPDGPITDTTLTMGLGERIQDEILIPGGWLVQSVRMQYPMIGRITQREGIVTPAARHINKYMVEALQGKEGLGLGLGKARYIIMPALSSQDRTELMQMYSNFRNQFRLLQQNRFPMEDPRRYSESFNIFCALYVYGWYDSTKTIELSRAADAMEELSHSDASAYVESLYGQGYIQGRPEEHEHIADAVLREKCALRQILEHYRDTSEFETAAEAIFETEAKLKSLEHSPHPAYTFFEMLSGNVITAPSSISEAPQYPMSRQMLMYILSGELLGRRGDVDNMKSEWINYIVEKMPQMEEFNAELKRAAKAAYEKEYLSYEGRIWKVASAHGTELPKGRLDHLQPAVNQWFGPMPGIRHLPQAIMDDLGAKGRACIRFENNFVISNEYYDEKLARPVSDDEARAEAAKSVDERSSIMDPLLNLIAHERTAAAVEALDMPAGDIAMFAEGVEHSARSNWKKRQASHKGLDRDPSAEGAARPAEALQTKQQESSPTIERKIKDIAIRLHGLALGEDIITQIAGCVETLYSDPIYRGAKGMCATVSDELGIIIQNKFPRGDVYLLGSRDIEKKRSDLSYPDNWKSVMDYPNHFVTYIKLGNQHIVIDANAQDYTGGSGHPVDVEIFVKPSFNELVDTLCLYYGGVVWELSEGSHELKTKRAERKSIAMAEAPQAKTDDITGESTGAIGKFIEIEPIRVDDQGELRGLIENIETGERLDLATIRVFESSQVSHGPDFLKNVERLISTTEMKAEERYLLESIIQKFKEVPPKHIFVQYDKLRAGFFGVGKPDLIVTSDKYLHLPTFFLHEIMEYVKYKNPKIIPNMLMLLNKDFKLWLLRHKVKYEQQGKGDYFFENENHYIIRAFIRQVFREIDKKVSSSIKLDNKWAESLTKYLSDGAAVMSQPKSLSAQSEFAEKYRSMATNSDKVNFLLKHYPMPDVTIDVETVKAGPFTPKGTGKTDKVADKHYKITLFGIEGSYEECILFHEFMHIWLEEKGFTFRWAVKDENTANYLFYIRNLVNDYIIEKENRRQFGNYYVDVTKELRDTDLANQFNFVVGEKGANNMGIFILAITCKAIAGLYPELSETLSAKVVGEVLQGDVFGKALRTAEEMSLDSSVEDYRAGVSKIHLLFTEDRPAFEGNSIIVNEGPVNEFTGVVDGLMSQIAQTKKMRRSAPQASTQVRTTTEQGPPKPGSRDVFGPKAETAPERDTFPIGTESVSMLSDVLKKLSDKNPEDVKAVFQYVAGTYGTFKELLARTRQPEEPRYVFMPLPEALREIKSDADRIAMKTSIEKSLGEAREIAEDILKANGFTNVNIVFYDGTIDDLRRALSSTSNKKGTINPKNGLAYINKNELKGLKAQERESLSVSFVKENVPAGGGKFLVGGHAVLALGVLDLLNNDRATDSDYWQYVLVLVRKLSKNEKKYEGITKDSFLDTIKKGDLEIDLPPIERERIDENMRVLSVTEKAVGTAM